MSIEREPQVYEVAVVGAGGFLGEAVMRAFRAAGVGALPLTLDRPLAIDGTVDAEAEHVKTVVWCASRINPRMAAEHPELITADLADLERSIAALRALPHPPRVVGFSSGGTVYGAPERPPFTEDMTPHPVNAYGEAKLAVERLLAESALDTVSLRVANAFGPGQRAAHGQGVLAYWIESVLAGEPVHLYGDPLATRDYVYVDDIAAAAVAAHAAPVAPQVVNIGSGRPTTLDDLLEALSSVAGALAVEAIRHPPRATDTLHSTLDISLAASALGWAPQVGLDEGVAAMWDWRVSQGTPA